MHCRHCRTLLSQAFIDLVNQPPSNAFLTAAQLDEPEIFYPLKLFTCPCCFLVQVDEYKKSQEIFSRDYVYFSSYSRSWVEHAERYVDMAVERFGLGGNSLVMEIASNDGYLLQFLVQRGIPCLGIEPSTATADAARSRGVESVTEFFSTALAERLRSQGCRPDLIVGNNVLAHVPDINDFLAGMRLLLKPDGIITLEFPHLMRMVEGNQFDTIYHEHFSYLSLGTVRTILASQGLRLFDVEQLSTHGGSLRVYACHAEDAARSASPAVDALLAVEEGRGMRTMAYYEGFQRSAEAVKADLLTFLIEQKRAGRLVAAYGAAAKGNTLLNYCGVKTDLVAFCADASPHKQGLFMPGSHIPVLPPEAVAERKPDVLLILPWNIKGEIMEQLAEVREWGGCFALAIPRLELLSPVGPGRRGTC
ncbi:class I SAM-dependent methyltransferase [Desulfovibrio aminophilus]|uniref:class I SAM-dependent methyltransferase n=1 Tax=Desulfovibrio aminophilus TaxID=81425 RepID=UPI000414A499|nr:class I SAM-dependent methyltransferase [Desulfovibrio aminophilus]